MRFIYPARLPDPRDFPDPVHDGDTLWLQIDRGRRDKTDVDSRLEDVLAPELSQLGGLEARSWVQAWIQQFNTGKWPFLLEMIRVRDQSHEITTFERYVVQVSTVGGVSLNVQAEAYFRMRGWPKGKGA